MKISTLGKVVLLSLFAWAFAPQCMAQTPDAAAESPAVTAPSPVVGDWKTIYTNRDGDPIHVILHIAADKDGTLEASIDAIEMQASNVAVSNIVFKGAKLTFDVDSAPGSYAGTISKDATQIDGTWTEDGSSHVLNFTRDVPVAPAAAPVPAAATSPAPQS
jgi:hypothetical protein